MNFEDKKIKVAAYKIEATETHDSYFTADELLELARNRRALPLKQLPHILDAADVGWASGRLELDTAMEPENCIIGDYVYLTLRSTSRKISAELLKATIRKKCAEYLKNNGAEYVSSKVRREIKEEAIQALEAQATICISTIPVIFCPNGTVYAGAATNTERDLLEGHFFQTFGALPAPVNAAALIGDQGRDINGTTGREFLTWLLWQTEIGRHMNFDLGAPFEFISPDDEKCNQATARGGQVANSAEVRAALNAGKALRKVKFTLAGVDGDIWAGTMNADTFAFTGLKLPESEEMDPAEMLAERIGFLDELFKWLRDAFSIFWEEFDSESYESRKKQWLNLR